MSPNETGKAYDQITKLWLSDEFNSENGIAQHKRAIGLVTSFGSALDVGCGCSGRIIDLLLSRGFEPEGIDVSAKMIEQARQKNPSLSFYNEDISAFRPKQSYDFISAWDSIWHLPLPSQKLVVAKLVSMLSVNGVLIFSFGGLTEQEEHTNNSMGPELYYSTLGVNGYLELLTELGTQIKHFEYDQHPELHAYLIVQKL